MTAPIVRTLRCRVALGLTSIAFAVWATARPFPVMGQSPAETMPGMEMKKAPAPESSGLTLIVAGAAKTWTAVEIKAMPQKTVHVHNEHTKADETYAGVALGDLLAQAGFKVEQATHRTMLRSYVQAEGTDHYWVLYSLTEVEPSEHDADVLVATSVDGHGLGADGQLKLISTRDKKPERWVRNLMAITVKTAE